MANPDFEKIKRGRLLVQGQETIQQVEHNPHSGAKLVMSGIIVPGDLVTADSSIAAVLVGAGSILRIKVTVDTYVAFSADPADPLIAAATTAASSPAVLLPANTINSVIATADFMRSSALLARVEKLSVKTVV